MNNEVHESVGGQATAAKKVDLSAIVDSLGDSKMFKVQTRDELDLKINNFLESEGPSFLEIKISPGSRKDLGRPTIKPIENKIGFMKFLER